MDFGLGADVDASGRLIEEEDASAAAKPTRNHDFLLIATGELANAGVRTSWANAEFVNVTKNGLSAGTAADHACAREGPPVGKTKILLDRHQRHERLAAAIFGDEGYSGIHRIARAGDRHGHAIHEDAARDERVGAEDA